MKKSELDHLLEKTVADALGVRLPARHRHTPHTRRQPQLKSQKSQHAPHRHMQPA